MPAISLKDAGVYFAPGGAFNEKMRAAASKGLLSAALRSVQLIQTQEIPRQSPVPVDRGVFRAGWRAERLGLGAVIYNAVRWAGMIEDGVPANAVRLSVKMQQNIAGWAQRRLGFDAAAAWNVAGAIMFRLKQRGIFKRGQGLKILANYTANRLPGIIREEVEREIAKLA